MGHSLQTRAPPEHKTKEDELVIVHLFIAITTDFRVSLLCTETIFTPTFHIGNTSHGGSSHSIFRIIMYASKSFLLLQFIWGIKTTTYTPIMTNSSKVLLIYQSIPFFSIVYCPSWSMISHPTNFSSFTVYIFCNAHHYHRTRPNKLDQSTSH